MSLSPPDELERLRRQLQAEQQQRKAAQQQAEAEQQQRKAAQQQTEAALQRAAVAEQRSEESENTTFPRFLELCHTLLSTPLRVQSDRSLTTQGSITNPKGKKHPTSLRPWSNFPELQQQYFDQAYSLLNPNDSEPSKLFPSRKALEHLGRTLCRRPLASEKDLEYYQRSAVEENVIYVMEELIKIREAGPLLNQCNGLEFENHHNTLSDNAEEVLQRQKQSRTDEACVFRSISGRRSLLFVLEYKPAHKVSVDTLRAGLRRMELREEVVLRETIPVDRGEKLNYNADCLVAAAVTQTFEYMIDNGLEFSCISTGPADVFLQVLEDDPTTVYYYLAEPNKDVGEPDDFGFRYPFTAISRMLSFCLLALQSPVRNQAWRDEASQKLYRWNLGFDAILHAIPENERQSTPPASVYSPPAYPVHDRSPYLLRSPYPLRSRPLVFSSDAAPSISFNSETSSSEGSFGESQNRALVVDTPTRQSGRTKRKRTSGRGSRSTQGASGRRRSPDYCTQKCLLGLKGQGTLDRNCPNYRRHRLHPGTESHQLCVDSFHQLVQAQLTADMDNYCDPLGKQGAHGALFKITLSSHGYTFLGKGTVEAFVPDLRHEGMIYERLAEVQGLVVPVCLGNMDLDRTYFLDVGVRIIHMLFLAWGGDSLYEATTPISAMLLEHEKQRSMDEVTRLGIRHNDYRLANMLWNIENKRVMVIDFERSTFRDRKRPLELSQVLDEVSPNKQQRRQHTYKMAVEAA